MHKQVLFSLHPSTLILLFLLLAACAPAPPNAPPPFAHADAACPAGNPDRRCSHRLASSGQRA